MHPVINVAVDAAHAAANIMRRQLQHVDAIPVERKARHDYVTEVDQACEDEIVRQIRHYHPDHAILAEEGGASGESEHVWIIDPLDGTSNYLHGIPHIAVSIAQQVRGRTEHAVVYDVMRDEMYYASRGGGAFMNQKRIRVSARSTLQDAVVATAFPFRQRGLLQPYARLFQAVFARTEDFRRAGTASLDLAWVAAGRLDAYYEIALKPWDVAAGALLVREAGGVVMDFEGSDNVEDSGTIVAAPYKLMTPMQQLIDKHWQPSQGKKKASD